MTEGRQKTSTPAVFTVSVSRPLSQAILVCATTLGLTASEGSDYDGLAQCKTLAAGATSLTFTVTVNGDNKKEPDERFRLLVAGVPFVQLADPVGVGTIVNDD